MNNVPEIPALQNFISPNSKPIILCVDDDMLILKSYPIYLGEALGKEYQIEIATSGIEALELIQEYLAEGLQIAVVISDQQMPGMSGDQFLTQVHRIMPLCRKIMLTGQAAADAVGFAVNFAKLYRYFAKPIDDHRDFVMTVQEAARSFKEEVVAEVRNKMMKLLPIAFNQMQKESGYEGLFYRCAEAIFEESACLRFCYIHVNNGQIGHVRAYTNVGQAAKKIVTTDLNREVSTLVVEKVINTKSVVNVANGPSSFYNKDSYITASKIRSILGVPVKKDDEIVGVFYLENRSKAGAFQQNDEFFADMIGQSMLLSYANLTLLQQEEAKVREATRELSQKNQDMADSIQYARRIQHGMLPSLNVLTGVFPDSTVIYRPKDVIGGDFYWFQRSDDRLRFAVCDCTGHGVPGALISLIGIESLECNFAQNPDSSPAEILSIANEKMRKRLGQDQPESRCYDGMELALCEYNPSTKMLRYAGSRRPLFLYRDGVLTEFQGDKHSIGGANVLKQEVVFNDNDIQLQTDDLVFLFTDGLVDQFGGEKNRKLTARAVRQFLNENAGLSMAAFGENLNKAFNYWKGANEQTDDLLVLAIRVP